MDSAANDLKKTSVIKREAMVSKLHNMQWLKNTSHSSNPEKVISKQRRDSRNNVEDKALLMEDSKVNLIEDSHKCDLTTNIRKEPLSSDTMLENSNNVLSKDANTVDTFLNAEELDIQETEEKKTLCVTIVENVITTQQEVQNDIDKEQVIQEIVLQNNEQQIDEKEENVANQENFVIAEQKTQCLIDEECRDHEIISKNNIEDKQQINGDGICSNFPNLSKEDQDTKEFNLTKHLDINSNDTKLTISHMTKESISKTSKNDKTSIEAKDKDVHTKKTVVTSRTNIKNETSTTLSKVNDNPSISTNLKKSISSPKTLSPIDKYGKIDRVNNKYTFTRKNTYTKETKQYSPLTKGIENKTKDVTAKSDSSKINIEKEPNKTANRSSSDRRTYNTSYNNYSNKPLQTQQRIPSKQFVPKLKGQEFRRSTSMLNRLDKNKTEKTTNMPTSSGLVSSEFERKNEKVTGEKNPSNDQKVCRITNIRSTTFVAYNKNSTASKPVITKSPFRNVEHTSMTCEKNQLCKRNNTLDGGDTNNIECKDVIKEKSDNVPTDTITKSNAKVDQLHPNDPKTDVKQQNDAVNHVHSANVNVSEIDTTSNNEHIVNPVRIDSCPMEDKVIRNLNVDCTKQEIVTSKNYEQEKTNSISKIDLDQQLVDINKNKELNPPKHLSNPLQSDKNITKSQTNSISGYAMKSGTMQQANIDQLENKQVIRNNDPTDSIQKIASKQASIYLQQIAVQTEDQSKRMSSREANCDKFYNQVYEQSSITNMTRFPQVSYTYGTPQFECNMPATSSNITTTMDSNRENLSTSHRYAPNMQQRPFMSHSDFSGHPVSVGQISRWNSSVQDTFQVEQFANTSQPPTMHVYNTGAYGPDDFNGAHVNCISPHSIIYTSSSPCIQTWNSQLQYPMPVLHHNAPCTNYPIFPNATNQSNNFNDVTASSMPMYMNDQHKYVHYTLVNNNPANAGPIQQAHANSHYVKNMHGCDLSNNCPVETKLGDDAAVRSNRYYKRYNQDNYQTVYDVPQYVTPISHSSNIRPQQPFVPTGINQSNVYCPPNQKYHKQNVINYMQVSKYPKDQKTPDFVCEDNNVEDIAPIISPKEYLTSRESIPDKTDHVTTRRPNQDFRTKSNMGYRQPPWQRYNSGFRGRNITYQDFSKEYTGPVSIGRGVSKTNQYRKM